jgi:glucose/arabinose dehydrogenase
MLERICLVLSLVLSAVSTWAEGSGLGSASLPFALSVPPGFRIELASARIGRARFVAVAPNGDVLISQLSRGRVIAVPAGADPRVEPKTVAEGLDLPNGLAFRGSDLYIATLEGVVVVPDYPTGLGSRHPLFSDLPRAGGHDARSLALASDGSVYISVGSDCNVCTEGDRRLATVHRYAADGSSGRIFASGLRNASGLAFDQGGRLWAVVNQRDNLVPDHRDLPPDELDLLVQGGDYGWPSAYPSGGKRLPNPEYPAADTGSFLPADFEFQAHSAPLQAAFYEGRLFPEAYRGALFVAFHGSWNREPPTGYKIVAVFFKEGRPVSIADFATGWLQGRRVLGRPVGLAFAADGSLYISDDTGYLFHVSYGR